MMLKNKNYVYGPENVLRIPADINYGKHMLKRFISFGDRVATIEGATGKCITYAEMSQLIVDIALSLTHLGVRKGDVIGVCSEERVEYMAAMFGIMCAGAVFTATDVSGKATILHRTSMVKPKIVFCSPKAYETHKETLQSVGCVETFIVFSEHEHSGAILFKDFLSKTCDVRDFTATSVDGSVDYAAILYSSGTTGLPKGVPNTHLNLLVHMLTKIDHSYYENAVVLTATEYYTFNISCLHAGATTVFTKKDRAIEVLEAVEKYKVKIVQQMPSTIFEMVHSPLVNKYDLSSMERILSASSPLRPSLIAEVKKRFPGVRDICQIYGATELGVLCSDERAPKGSKPGSVGIVSDGLIMKVVDLETEKAVGPNERGEIRVKSQSLFPGYLGYSKTYHLDSEGFYKTGDVGYYDDDRYFFIVDRVKDLIKYNAFPVAPAELEAVLARHPSVLIAAVVGKPDEQFGELPTAFVVLGPGSDDTEQQITEYVNQRVADWMPLAGGVRFIESIPRGTRGKIDRKTLRQMLCC